MRQVIGDTSQMRRSLRSIGMFNAVDREGLLCGAASATSALSIDAQGEMTHACRDRGRLTIARWMRTLSAPHTVLDPQGDAIDRSTFWRSNDLSAILS